MADRELASFMLPPSGETVLTPPLSGAAGAPTHIEVEGVFEFGYAGTRFDALYRAGSDGVFSTRSQYLQWSPEAPSLVSENAVEHRYVFRVPSSMARGGGSLGLRLHVDRLVSEYLITPSEVRQSLSGAMRVRVLQAPPPPVPARQILAWAAAPALLVVGGAGWIIRKRTRLQGLDADLRRRVEQIDEHHDRAVRAARAGADRLLPIGERLASLRTSAVGLARQAQELRRARGRLDRAQLEREIALQQERVVAAEDDGLRRDTWSVVAEKEKSLRLLGELEASEARCLVRLEKIEAVLLSAALSLRGGHGQAALAASTRDDDAICHTLDAEVAAIREVQDELTLRLGR